MANERSNNRRSIRERLRSFFSSSANNTITDGSNQANNAKERLNNQLGYSASNGSNPANPPQTPHNRYFSIPYTPIEVINHINNLAINQQDNQNKDNFTNYGNQPPGISGEYLSAYDRGSSHTAGYNSNNYNQREMQTKLGLLQRLKTAYHVVMGHGTDNPNNAQPNKSPNQPTSSYSGTQKHSPSLDLYNREYYEPAERRAVIGQIMTLIAENPILDAAIRKFANGAVEAGWVISVDSAMRGETQLKQAQICLDRLKDNCSLEYILPSMAYDMVAYGDAFIQIVINNKTEEIDEVKQMPIATMERRTDDRDNWIDPNEAFLQRDTNTLSITGRFVEGQIIHARHLYTAGHRYGKSQIYSGRGVAKDALDAMKSLLSRRLANMPFRHLDVTDIDGTGVSDTRFQEFIKNTSRKVAIAEGRGISPWDDLYTTGVTVDVKGGDGNLGTTEDIDMQLDAVLALLGVSRQLLGWGTTINRDVLDEQRSELYAAQAQFVKSVTHQILMPLFKTALVLSGIDPREIKISVEFAQSLTNLELQRRLQEARKDYVTGGMTHKSYVKVCGAYYGFDDIDRELEDIESERGTTLPPSLNALSIPGLGASKGLPEKEPKLNGKQEMLQASSISRNGINTDNVIEFNQYDEIDNELAKLNDSERQVLVNKLLNFAKKNNNYKKFKKTLKS